MSIAKCGGILIDDSALKIVNGIITVDGGSPTDAVVANCGGLKFDATYFKKINNVITDINAESVSAELLVNCGGLLLDSEYFSVGDDGLTYEAGDVPSSECNIDAFVINEKGGVISGTNIVVEMPKDTVVTALAPTITISDGASVSPESGVEQDFTNPVTYTVTAQDETTTKEYVVTVVVATE